MVGACSGRERSRACPPAHGPRPLRRSRGWSTDNHEGGRFDNPTHRARRLAEEETGNGVPSRDYIMGRDCPDGFCGAASLEFVDQCRIRDCEKTKEFKEALKGL